MLPIPSVRRPRSMRAVVALCIAGLTAVAIGPATVLASSSALASPTSLAGQSTLTAIPFTASGGGVTATGTAAITVHWTQPAILGSTFDPNLVRQGRTLNLSDSYTRTPTGAMSVDYTLQNLEVSWGSIGPLSLGSPTYTTSGNCNLIAGGTDYVCHLTSGQISLLDTSPIAGPFVKLSLATDVTVTPQGIATIRQATFGGNPGSTASLSLGESPITDLLVIPCTVGAGDTLDYGLGALSTTPGLSVKTSLVFDVGTSIPNPLFPFPDPLDPVIYITFASPTIDLGTTTGAIAVTGAGAAFDMGAVQKNNIPPVVNAGPSPYAGNEGTPIQFDGSASSSVCGFPTLRWDFSDGGVAFGAKPFHTFTDGRTYSGQLTATDATGLVSTTTFSIDVASLPPVVAAGPNTSSPWGRLVAFNGSATARGADDQATLTYSWDFGDGTPSASGGSGVLHAYTTPGVYTATLTVTNEDGQSSSDSRSVTVVKRTVSVGYLGDTAGTYDTQGVLSASLVDQFGSTVNGRSIAFTVNNAAAGAAVSNSSGIGSTAFTPLLDAGSYPTLATFAGDGLYVGSSGSGSIAIARKATMTTYTGALSGGPNKTITLSATLVDATGKALAGRTIDFKLGIQTKSAVTNAFGVASTTLQLNQKNAKYPLTATWTPVLADANHYVGSAASTTFSLQAR